MARNRFWLHCSIAVLVASITAQTGRSQVSSLPSPVNQPQPAASTAAGTTCKIYSLADLGDDPNLGNWIADTIPQMIQPGAWNGVDGKSKLSYFAPGKVLVINQTAAVHTQVEEFLKNLKKSLPEQTTVRRDVQVTPAQYVVPSVTPMQAGYPVPAVTPAPKHLFHFIIRYEGEGIIDENVVKFAKALSQVEKALNGSCETPSLPPNGPATNVAPPPGAPSSLVPATPASGSGTTLPSPFYLQQPPQYYVPPPAAAPRMPPADAPTQPPPPPPPPSGPRRAGAKEF
jgi:hypothetical protein